RRPRGFGMSSAVRRLPHPPAVSPVEARVDDRPVRRPAQDRGAQSSRSRPTRGAAVGAVEAGLTDGRHAVPPS
ncbi:hypothetical protein NGM37_15925, partial [Streptomyces sp. TRM76130]|nr:hypothetical protein [Streptomyces sp. TRM76130]